MTIQCAVPFVTSFSRAAGGFRNCCMTDPAVVSRPDEDWKDWWRGPALAEFRKKLTQDSLPLDCQGCQLQESLHGHSFRTAVNQTVDLDHLDCDYPRNWNVTFGNICNLACWTCNENSSSVIESHKKHLQLLPQNFVSPRDTFHRIWQDLQEHIKDSYQYHDTIGLTILGGEPLYNDTVLEFLHSLIQLGLAARTRLEFHTNATQCNRRVQDILSQGHWKHVSIFLSLDAAGPKAEWLRYGCKWNRIEHNIPMFRSLCDYLQVQCTVSVLNIGDLVDLKKFCDSHDLPLITHVLSHPAFMSLASWDKDPADLVSLQALTDAGFAHYFAEIGRLALPGTKDRLANYVHSFDSIRSPLAQFDTHLARILDHSYGVDHSNSS